MSEGSAGEESSEVTKTDVRPETCVLAASATPMATSGLCCAIVHPCRGSPRGQLEFLARRGRTESEIAHLTILTPLWPKSLLVLHTTCTRAPAHPIAGRSRLSAEVNGTLSATSGASYSVRPKISSLTRWMPRSWQKRAHASSTARGYATPSGLLGFVSRRHFTGQGAELKAASRAGRSAAAVQEERRSGVVAMTGVTEARARKTKKSKPSARVSLVSKRGGPVGGGESGHTPVRARDEHAVAGVADVEQQRLEAARAPRRDGEVVRLDWDPRGEVGVEEAAQRVDQVEVAVDAGGVGEVPWEQLIRNRAAADVQHL